MNLSRTLEDFSNLLRNANFSIYASSKDEEDEEEDDDGTLEKVKTISVENSFMEEKQQAICVLREFSADTGAAFHPFLQTAFEAVWKVIDFPDEDIRRSAVDAVTQFAIAYYKAGDEGAKEFATRSGQLRSFSIYSTKKRASCASLRDSTSGLTSSTPAMVRTHTLDPTPDAPRS